MDVDGAAAGIAAYDFALGTARQRGHRRATRQLEAIGPPPHLRSKQFATRVRWATNFGGVTIGETYATLARGLLASLVRSPDYSAADVIRTVPPHQRDTGCAAARASQHGPGLYPAPP